MIINIKLLVKCCLAKPGLGRLFRIECSSHLKPNNEASPKDIRNICPPPSRNEASITLSSIEKK